MAMTEPEVAQAFDEALRTGDEHRRWDLVSGLHQDGGAHALRLAERLHRDPEAPRRALAADVLSQLGAGPGVAAREGAFRDRALALLLAMAEREQDPAVLRAVAIGFGHIGDERCMEPLVR